MKKFLLLSLTVFAFTHSVRAQQHAPLAVATTGAAPKQEIEHAPTVAQCQADQRLWLSKLEDHDAHALDGVSVHMLWQWQHEMDNCKEVDPPNARQYEGTGNEAIFARGVRMWHFIERHKLFQQFITEDAEGQR